MSQKLIFAWECQYENCDELLDSEQHTKRRKYCDVHQKIRHIDRVKFNQHKMNGVKRQTRLHRQANTVKTWKREAMLYLLKTNKKVSIGEIHAFCAIRKKARSIPTVINYLRHQGHIIYWRFPYYHYEGMK